MGRSLIEMTVKEVVCTSTELEVSLLITAIRYYMKLPSDLKKFATRSGWYANRLSQRTPFEITITLPTITFRAPLRKTRKTYRNPVIYARELHQEMVREGLTRKQLAERHGVSSDRITQWLCLLKFPDEKLLEIEELGDNWERQVITERQLRSLRRGYSLILIQATFVMCALESGSEFRSCWNTESANLHA